MHFKVFHDIEMVQVDGIFTWHIVRLSYISSFIAVDDMALIIISNRISVIHGSRINYETICCPQFCTYSYQILCHVGGLVMWEGQALPHDTKFGNSRCEIVGRRVIFIWSLIHGLRWSGLIKAEPRQQQPQHRRNWKYFLTSIYTYHRHELMAWREKCQSTKCYHVSNENWLFRPIILCHHKTLHICK